MSFLSLIVRVFKVARNESSDSFDLLDCVDDDEEVRANDGRCELLFAILDCADADERYDVAGLNDRLAIIGN